MKDKFIKLPLLSAEGCFGNPEAMNSVIEAFNKEEAAISGFYLG